MNYVDKIKSLLEILERNSLDGYLIPMEDNHLSEFVTENDNQIKFLSGFEGTGGELLICKNNVGLRTDSRYYNIAPRQLQESGVKLLKRDEVSKLDFYKEKGCKNIGVPGDKIGHYQFRIAQAELKTQDIELKAVNDLLQEMKEYKHDRIFCPKVKVASNNNIKIIQDELYKNDADYFMTINLDIIAWATDYRGNDVENNVYFYGYLLVTKNQAILYTNNIDTKDDDIVVKPYEEFEKDLFEIKNKNILIDRTINQKIYSQLKQNNNKLTTTLKIQKTRSILSNNELKEYKKYVFYDSLALIQLFDIITKNDYSEVDIENMLIQIKENLFGKIFIKPSFKSIVAVNSADMHHSNDRTKKFTQGDIVLIDSGSHYLFGSTDISRTLSKGTPKDENVKKDYTLVLKGLIKNYLGKNIKSGSVVDENSRYFLKKEGKNYDSATGHGVGIVIHQNPPSIEEVGGEIEENMLFTIEPGYYSKIIEDNKSKEYGIRIEDMVVIQHKIIENLVYIPYQRDLISVELLDEKEISYLNHYNEKLRKLFVNFLPKTNDYFYRNTEPFIIDK